MSSISTDRWTCPVCGETVVFSQTGALLELARTEAQRRHSLLDSSLRKPTSRHGVTHRR